MSNKKPIQCPGCAAGLEYDPQSAALKCPYCGTVLAVETDASAKPVVEINYEEAVERASAMPQGTLSGSAMQVECQTCGAAVVFEPPEVAGQCPFCTTKIIVQPHAADPLIAPQGLLPFALPKQKAVDSLKSWLASRWFAPNDLKMLARPEKIEGIYLPFWTYDSRTSTDYTGARGEHYWVTESYQAVENGRSVVRQRQVRKTRWYPTSGRVENAFDDILVPATRAVQTSRLDDLHPWDLHSTLPYSASYLAGFKAQRYQLELQAGFAEAQKRMAPRIQATIAADIGGDEQQIHSVNTKVYDVTFKHLLLPVWLGAYRYSGKLFQIAVNARTGEVSGERPYSAVKITLFILAIIAAIVLIAVVSKLQG